MADQSFTYNWQTGITKTPPPAPMITEEQKSFLPKKKIKIQYENGAIVEFDKEPTQQDVDEAWEAVGKDYKPTSRKDPGYKMYFNYKEKEGKQRSQERVIGIAGSIPKQIGNIGGFVGSVGGVLGIPGAKQWGQEFQQSGQDVGTMVETKLGARPESPYTKQGEFVGEIAGSLAPAGMLGKVAKGATLASKIPFATKLAPIVGGATEGLTFDVMAQGKPGLGTAFGAALPIGGAVLGKTGEYLSKALPERLQFTNIINAGDLQKTSVRLSKLYGKEADVKDVSRWALDRGIRGTERQQIDQIDNWVQKAIDEKQQALTAVKKTFQDETTQSLKNALSEKLGLYTEKGVATAGNEAKVARYNYLIGKDRLTMNEVEEGRSLLGEGLFTKQGTMKEIASKEGWQKIWVDTSKWVDNKLPGIRAVNKDIEVGIALSQAIAKKEATKLAKQIASYLGFSGLTGAGVGYITGDWQKGLTAATLGFGSTQLVKLLRSPAVASNIAYYLNKLSPEARASLNALKNGGRITIDEASKMADEIKLLPPPSGKPTSANTVNVLPEIGYSPGVLQKQEQAIGSKIGKESITTQPLQNLPKSGINEMLGIKPKQPKMGEVSPGAPIIQKSQQKQVLPKKETPKTPQVEKKSLPLAQREAVKYSNEENGLKEINKSSSKFGIPLSKFSDKSEGRLVYKIGNGNVLKVAKNYKGLIQNEGAKIVKDNNINLFPEVKDIGNDYIIVEEVTPYNKLNKENKKIIDDWYDENKINSLQGGRGSRWNPKKDYVETEEQISFKRKYGIPDDVKVNYDDIEARNLGLSSQGDVKILDEGILSDVGDYPQKTIDSFIKKYDEIGLYKFNTDKWKLEKKTSEKRNP